MTYLSDTSPEIEKVQIALFRKAGVAQRVMRLQSLSQTMVNLSRRAIARSHPEFNQQQVDLFFVRLHYGDKLAEGLKNYLNKHAHE